MLDCQDLLKKVLKNIKIYFIRSENNDMNYSRVRYKNKIYLYVYDNSYKLVSIVIEVDRELCYQLSSR